MSRFKFCPWLTYLRVFVLVLPAADRDEAADEDDAQHTDQEGEQGGQEEAPPFPVLRGKKPTNLDERRPELCQVKCVNSRPLCIFSLSLNKMLPGVLHI